MERQAEVCALRVYLMSKEGYDMTLTLPSPVVTNTYCSGSSGVGLVQEKAVAFVWTDCGCGSRAVYVVAPGVEEGRLSVLAPSG